MTAEDIKQALQDKADKKKEEVLKRFFKTGKGQYGEGDIFIGVVVPAQREIARKFKQCVLEEVGKLLQDPIHECRLTALFILVGQFLKSDERRRKEIYELYLKKTTFINNWDLVDSSAPNIVGTYLLDKPEARKTLLKLAKSKSLWEKRIAMMATFTFIRAKRYQEALELAEILLHDEHDLIQKAVGWMLREIGNRDLKIEEKFLDKYAKEMPRTALRYAVEKISKEKKDEYMGK